VKEIIATTAVLIVLALTSGPAPAAPAETDWSQVDRLECGAVTTSPREATIGGGPGMRVGRFGVVHTTVKGREYDREDQQNALIVASSLRSR
jgi:hypothetical protein